MKYLHTIKVNEHFLVATTDARVADVAERAILEMAYTRLLPDYSNPAFRIGRQEPYVVRERMTAGPGVLACGQLKYATPYPIAARLPEWDSATQPPIYTVNVTDSVILMLDELKRTIRENLRVFI